MNNVKPIEVVAGVVSVRLPGRGTYYMCGLRSEAMGNGGIHEFPGGKVEPGETHHEALKREWKEELNADVRSIDAEPFISVIETNDNGKSYRVHFYHIRLEGTSSLENLEHTEIVWVTTTAMKYMNWAKSQAPVIEHLMGGGDK